MNIQRAVVTGCNGLVGRRLVGMLAEMGIPTEAVDCTPRSYECNFHQFDLTKPSGVDALLTPETTVFHLAARTNVAASVKAPRDDFEVNVIGTMEVLESVRRTNAKLVFASSSAVFDPASPLPHSETSPKRASSPYGAGKLACEGYCGVYHRCYGLDIRIVRLFNAYGPGMTQFAIYDFFHKIRNADKSIQLQGDGNQLRDFLYLDDVAAGFVRVAESGKPGEDYNLGSGIPVRIVDLARQMAVVMGKPDLKLRTQAESFPGDVPAWYADIAKIRGLSFEPRTKLTDGLQATIAYLQSHVSAT